MQKQNVTVPNSPHHRKCIEGNLVRALKKEEDWLKHAIQLLSDENVVKGDAVAWSAYHASLQDNTDNLEAALTQLLPLFYEKAATAAMIKHGMNVVREATQFLNPGQIPVIALDAPLYALAKSVQWYWPHTHGENKYVVFFGGLHIEMAIWKTIGDYLEASGWTTALAQADIASSGTVDSFLKASHLTRTRHAHQVSALALAKLQEEAFLKTERPHNDKTKEAWRQEMITKSPTFQYWNTILNMEILGLIFVRAHRERDFLLYVESMKALPWFFALDHQNYARWIPVHIRDMESLPASIQEEFEGNGNWVISKTTNRFSSIPIDQAHEQNNELVKGSGGAVGLTENPSAFKKWMIAGPEQARFITEFEREYMHATEENNHHHEEDLSTQKTFKEQSLGLAQIICDMSNPFLDDGPELLALDSRNVIDSSVAETIRTIEALGKKQYDSYNKSVITDHTRSIHEPIKRNTLPLFRRQEPKTKTKHEGQISMLKDDVALFSRLYIVMQHRNGDMNAFFTHENHPYPPSISERGKLRLGKKSDLLDMLKQSTQNNSPTIFDVKVLDGAAVVHLLPIINIATFDEYAADIFVPHITIQLNNSNRVDVVWDTYVANSIKESTREKRGKSIRRKVAGKTRVPGNWPDFLHDPTNKQELFQFLTDKIASSECPADKEIYIKSGTAVVNRGNSHCMGPCNHEEADTRLLIHLLDALKKGAAKCLVRTVDTDVIVILIGKYYSIISRYPAADIWVAFGSGKNFIYLDINAISKDLGVDKFTALPLFHCFTGCDTTSSFFGKGKKSAWEAWNAYPEVTQAFNNMVAYPFHPVTVQSRDFQTLERFTIIMYDKTSTLHLVNEARKELFCQKNKAMENIPPTQDALLQHTRRVTLQAGIWTTCDKAQQQIPSPEGWGWTFNEETKSWVPVWNDLPIAAKACSELVKCGCKSTNGCGSRCSCKKANWRYTRLCSCKCDK